MKIALMGLAFAGSLAVSGVAAASVVTFDDISAPNGILFSSLATPGVLNDGGLTFTADSYFAGIWPSGPPGLPAESNGTNNVIYAGGAGPLAITKTGTGSFNLSQLQLSLSWFSGDNAPGGPTTDTVQVSWNGPSAGSTTLTLGQGFQTYVLGITDATEVDISGLANQPGYWSLDNLAFSSIVPEPAAWTLMIGGVFGVGAMLRRRRLAPAAAA